MKRNLLIVLGIFLAAVIGTSCGKIKMRKGESNKTGWKYDNKYNGGFTVAKKIKAGPGPGLIAIEGGTFVMGGSLNQDLGYDYDNLRRRVTVASFYMDETEVANIDWLEYLHWIRRNYPQDARYYYEALPDTLVWRRPLSYNEPYVYNYLRHPAFQNYPVVGITWDQANQYAEWRTDRVNENLLRDKGYMLTNKQKMAGIPGGTGTTTTTSGGTDPFNTDIYLNGQIREEDGKKLPKDKNAAGGATGNAAPVRSIRLEDGILKQPYRLPTEAEWEYAALSLAGNTEYENIEDGKIYPWNGLGVRSPKRRTQGLILANFKRGEGDNMGVGGYLNDKADITSAVNSYLPNDFGLYNMAGNVNEWTADVYRKLSFEDFEDFNPYRGNQYVDKRLADKEKGLYAKDKYGRPIKDPSVSGKKQSWEEMQSGKTAVDSNSTIAGKPYNPDFRGHLDTVNAELYGVTTLINDRSRVYKGGSWNDRAYWLNPATRRPMQQDETTAEMGFRCAMSMVGNPQIYTKGQPEFRQPKSKAPRKIK